MSFAISLFIDVASVISFSAALLAGGGLLVAVALLVEVVLLFKGALFVTLSLEVTATSFDAPNTLSGGVGDTLVIGDGG